MNKRIFIFFNIFFLMFYFVSFFKVTYGASVKYQVAEAAVDKLVDETIYTVAKQTGYKIATQEQVDFMRASFKKQFPSWDFTTMPDINYDDNTSIAKYDRESKEVIVKLDNDMRNWVNTYITGLPRIETVDNSDSSTKVGNHYKASSMTGYVSIYYNDWKDPAYTYNFTNYNTRVYYDIKLNHFTTSSGCHGSNLTFTLYNSSSSVILTKVLVSSTYSGSSEKDYPDISSYNYYTREFYKDGTPVSSYVNETTIDHTPDFTNFVPYPTKQSELTDTTKLPMEIRVPATTDSDNVITPNVSPLPFPSVTQTPDTDGKVKVGDSTLVYQKPTVDPSTGTIVDPVTTPDTNTVPNTDDTTGQTPDSTNYNVPTTTPMLDFSPLKVATLKFPFCIPWDIYDTINLLKADSECPKFHVNSMSYLGFEIIPQFDFDLATIPHLDEIVRIFRFFEVLLFLFFWFMSIRSRFIRG